MGAVKYKKPSARYTSLSTAHNHTVETITNIRGSGIVEIFQISVKKIENFDKQARTRFDVTELEGLIASIKEVGIINPLLIVKSDHAGYFKVVNGERRLRAAQKIGLEKVPCIILQDANKSELIAVIDNIQRAELHPIELASAYESLINNYGDKKLISEKIGVGYTSFLEILKLNTLPQEIKNHILNNNLRSRSIFRYLLKLDNLEKMQSFLGITKKEAPLKRKEKIIGIYLTNNVFEIEISEKKISSVDLDILCNKLEELTEKLKKIVVI